MPLPPLTVIYANYVLVDDYDEISPGQSVTIAGLPQEGARATTQDLPGRGR